MEALNKIINNNLLILNELKPKIFECCSLIINKYPMAYKNLCKNLENIKIEYINDSNKKLLENNNALSLYEVTINTLILDKYICDQKNYKNLLVHELLHVSSSNDEELGLQGIDSGHSVSLNEGLTEYLTREILNSHNFGILVYDNDINNVNMFRLIVGEECLINNYFNGSLVNVLTDYLNKIGTNNNLKEIIKYMDLDNFERCKKMNYENEYKDKYISFLVDDISKMDLNNNNEVIALISCINSFVRGQYQSFKIPDNIKSSIENSLNNVLTNYENKKGKSYE